MGWRQMSSTHTRLDFRPNILWDHYKLVEWTFFPQRMWRVLEWHWTAVWPLTNMSVPFAVLLLFTSETLERIQNTAARLVTRTNRDDHITPVLKGIHWLPVQERIMFKILLLTYKTVNGSAPSYLSELVSSYTPSRSLRSSSKNLLCRRKTKLLQYGGRSFFSAAPKLWNELPDSVIITPSWHVWPATQHWANAVPVSTTLSSIVIFSRVIYGLFH